eukprot:3236974-Heterocapsa_arctica.AAC.1
MPEESALPAAAYTRASRAAPDPHAAKGICALSVPDTHACLPKPLSPRVSRPPASHASRVLFSVCDPVRVRCTRCVSPTQKPTGPPRLIG